MTKEKFLEKAAKQFRKVYENNGYEGVEFSNLIVTVLDEDSDTPLEIDGISEGVSVSVTSVHDGEIITHAFSLDELGYGRKQEDDELSVKELVRPLITEFFDEEASAHAPELFAEDEEQIGEEEEVHDLELDLGPEPDMTLPFPDEEPEKEALDDPYSTELSVDFKKGDIERNKDGKHFVNDVHNNCGIEYDNDYSTFEEFKQDLLEQLPVKFDTSRFHFGANIVQKGNETFWFLNITGLTPNENGVTEVHIPLNEFYKDYRTSEEYDEKMMKRATKLIKKEAEARFGGVMTFEHIEDNRPLPEETARPEDYIMPPVIEKGPKESKENCDNFLESLSKIEFLNRVELRFKPADELEDETEYIEEPITLGKTELVKQVYITWHNTEIPIPKDFLDKFELEKDEVLKTAEEKTAEKQCYHPLMEGTTIVGSFAGSGYVYPTVGILFDEVMNTAVPGPNGKAYISFSENSALIVGVNEAHEDDAAFLIQALKNAHCENPLTDDILLYDRENRTFETINSFEQEKEDSEEVSDNNELEDEE